MSQRPPLRLTLRTLLAYLDDTLEPHEARDLGLRVSQSDYAKELVDRIKKVTRRRGLATPTFSHGDDLSDPNTVAEYLSDALSAEQLERVEQNCLGSDAHLAEIAACHQILTLVLAEPVLVPPTANQRMYKLVRRPASQPDRMPGRTSPIARLMPTDDLPETAEEDAALLLGMSRYSPGDPRGHRVFQISLVGAVAFSLLIAVLMALPDRSARGLLIGSQFVAAPTPKPSTPTPTPPMEVVKKLPVEPPPTMVQDRKIAPPPRLVEEVVMAKPEAKAPLAAPPQPPREARRPLGKLEAADQVVVVAKAAPGALFERLNAANPDIMSADALVALPGYKAKLRLNSGAVLDLWANTPEQVPNSVYETRLRLHEPPEGLDADVTLNAGRIFLTTTKAVGSRIRVRIAQQIWDVALADERSEMLIEVVSTLEAGLPFLKDEKDSPRVSAAFAITKGTVAVNAQGLRDFGPAPAPRFYIWDNKTQGIDESNDRARLEYFTRFPTPPLDAGGAQQARTLAMQKTLSELASTLTARDGLRTRIAEILSDDGEGFNLNREIASRFAVYAAGAIDEPIYLVDSLNSGLKPFLRSAATITIDRWLPIEGDHANRLYQQLLAKQIKEETSLTILKLLRRYAPENLKRHDTAESLVNLLETGDTPAVRELAFWSLVSAIDPMALENPRLSRYDAGGTPAEREPVVAAWKARLPEIQKRMMEEKK